MRGIVVLYIYTTFRYCCVGKVQMSNLVAIHAIVDALQLEVGHLFCRRSRWKLLVFTPETWVGTTVSWLIMAELPGEDKESWETRKLLRIKPGWKL